MQKHSRIKAIFVLSIFSMLIMHQAFPHLHHQHEDSHSHSHSDVAHSGEHHHHDNSSKEEKESPYGFFGFFMDMHVHSSVSSDSVILKRNTVEQETVVDKDIVKSTFHIQGLSLTDNRQKSDPPIYHPPNDYFNPYLSYLDLRGPPSLG